jgi:peptidoglycan/LPS O-acetylase OafA/YrhL
MARWAGREARITLMITCVGMIATAVVVRAALADSLPLSAYVLFPARMDSLATGAFLALWVRGKTGESTARSVAGPVLAVGAILLVALGWLSADERSYLHPMQVRAGYTLWAVVFGALVVLAASDRASRVQSMLCTRFLRWVGRHSYGLYLVHFPILYGLVAVGAASAGFLFLSVATIVASFLVAASSRRWIERPALELKRHFRYGYSPAGSSVATNHRPGVIAQRGAVPRVVLRTRSRASTLIAAPRP